MKNVHFSAYRSECERKITKASLLPQTGSDTGLQLSSQVRWVL